MAVGRLADHCEVVVWREDGGEIGADYGLVVGKHD